MKSRNEEKRSIVYKILFCLFGAIFLLGFGIIVYHLSISYRARALNNDLQKEIYISSMRPPENTAFLVRKGETAPKTASNGDPNRDSMEEAGEKNSQEEQEQQYQRQISMDFTALREINPDAVAWLKSDGLKIEYPVMYSDDNSYYLSHLYNGEHNYHGSLFVDYRNRGDFTDTNTVIYGHHMRDRSMFGSLEEYRSQEFYDTFPTMTLYTPEGDYLIEFISGTIEDGNYEFIEFEFENDEAYMAYLADLRERSLFQSDVEVGPWDKIITLCTCSNNYMNARFMLVGKMVELYSTAE